MKNPLKTHKHHQKQIDEIFGKIANFFSQSKPESSPEELSRLQYLMNIEKYKLNMMDPSTCDKGIEIITPDKNKGNKKGNQVKYSRIVPPKSGRVKLSADGEILIDDDKIIKDYSELYIENTVRGVGMGSFRKLNVRDLVCYDLSKDTYGIAWLLSENSSYTANKISGKLLVNKFNQSVNFDGTWNYGKFYGKFEGSKALNKLKGPVSKDKTSNKFKELQNLILRTKNYFDVIFKFQNFDEIKKKIYESDDDKLKNLFPEILKIKKYLSTIELKKGIGDTNYVVSDEIYKLKSRIDQGEDIEDISSDIDDLYKYFKIIESKIKTFDDNLSNLYAQPQSTTSPNPKIRVK